MVQVLICYSIVFASVNLDNIIIGGIAFGINSGAYVAEIVRSGIMSIDKGQMEAGRSLGLSSGPVSYTHLISYRWNRRCVPHILYRDMSGTGEYERKKFLSADGRHGGICFSGGAGPDGRKLCGAYGRACER